MGSRLKLHELLLSIAGPNVYYQVPSNLVMVYPCVKYTLNDIKNEHANDSVYNQSTSYTITVMSKDADYTAVNAISKLIKCSFDRRYVQDNIYHTVFNIYY